MSEKKPMPKCPYCGWEMQHHFDYPMSYCDVRFYCKHCNTMSPSARGCQTSTESVEKALEEAYEKAMRRYEEPNRVLTLEEVLEIANENNVRYNHVCWLERNSNYPIWPGCIDTLEDGYLTFNEVGSEEFDRYTAKEYGIEWRCWLRMPTNEEMVNTPWEEKQNEKV